MSNNYYCPAKLHDKERLQGLMIVYSLHPAVLGMFTAIFLIFIVSVALYFRVVEWISWR